MIKEISDFFEVDKLEIDDTKNIARRKEILSANEAMNTTDETVVTVRKRM